MSGDTVARKAPSGRADANQEEPDFPARPMPGDDYLAYGHFRSRDMACLHVYFNAAERKDHGRKKQQLQYCHMEPDDDKSGFDEDRQSFSIPFGTSDGRVRLTVRGRNIENIYDLITYGRMAWIESIDARRDIPELIPDNAEVITSITLKPED